MTDDEVSARFKGIIDAQQPRIPSGAERETAVAIVADKLGIMISQARAIVDNLDTSRGASLTRLARLLTEDQLDELGR